jgi:fumarate hydratase class II
MALGKMDRSARRAIIKAANEVIEGKLDATTSRWSSGRRVPAPSRT